MRQPVPSASDRFRVIRCLGEGATGRVFEVLDGKDGGRFALKRLRVSRLSPERVAGFKDEFRAYTQISHPNLAHVYELHYDEHGLSVLMELVDGVDFLQYVRPDQGPSPKRATASDETARVETARTSSWTDGLSLERLRASLPQLASGLLELHARDYVHCDIKPENVLVTRSGRVVVLDFGLSGPAAARRARAGTPTYMAPEQLAGPFSDSADWYAVGVLLYCALTGRLPPSSSSYAAAHVKRFSRPLDPRLHAPGLPDDLVELALRMLEPNPKERPSGREIARLLGIAAPSVSMVPVPFVGRERELQQLATALAATRRAGVRRTHVRGESGIGKTALVQRFARWVEASGGLVFRGRCYKDALVPYKGLDSLVDSIATRLAELGIELDAEARSDLSTLFPIFGGLSEDRGAARDQPPIVLRTRWVMAFRRVLESLARRQQLVLWIDDFQWSDFESIDLLSDVLAPSWNIGVLLIIAFRTEQGTLGERATYLRTHLPCDHDVEVAPLPSGDVHAAMLATGAADAAALSAIVEESQGNPFFAEQLLRAHVGGHGPRALSLRVVLALRLSALLPAHRDYVELVSLASRPLEEEVLRIALATTPELIVSARRVLVCASIVRLAESDTRRVEPYHDRIRQQVLSSVPTERARGHHRALAAAYEAAGSMDPEILALHYREAGNTAEASAYAERAGDAAMPGLAFDHAAQLYASAIEMAADSSLPRLLMKYAEALSNAGKPAMAAEALMKVLEGHPEDVELELRAGDEYLRAGDIQRGTALLRRAARALGEPMLTGTLPGLVAVLWRGRRLRRLRIAEQNGLTPSVERRLSLCLTLARRLVLVDYLTAAQFQLRHLELALASGSRPDIVQGLALQACFSAQMPSFIAGGFERAEQLLTLARELVSPTDTPLTRACVLFAPGSIALANGRWRDAREALERVVELLHEKTTIGLQWDAAFSQSIIIQMLWLEGDVSELRKRMRGYLREARGHLMAESIHRLRGIVLLALCDDLPDDARRLADDTIDQWPRDLWLLPQHFHGCALSEIDLYRGDARAARARARACGQRAKRAGFHSISFYYLTDLALYVRCALALGRHVEAEREIDRIERCAHAWATAIAGALRGCLLSARGRRSCAVRQLRGAIPELDRWQLGLFASAARHRLARLTADPALERSALDEFAERGVRDPQRLIDSLLPM